MRTATLIVLVFVGLAAAQVPVPCYHPELLKAEHPVSFLPVPSGFYSLDMLTLAVDAPRVFTRTDPVLSIGLCLLPYAAKTSVGACDDMITVVQPWSSYVSCGAHLVASTSVLDTYEGTLHAQYSEIAGIIDTTQITRSLSADMVFDILFQKTVHATSSLLNIWANPIIAAALMDLHTTVDPTGAHVGVGTAVSVQNPFLLTITGFSIPSAVGTSTFLVPPVQTIPSDPQHLVQEWAALIVPAQGICQFTDVKAIINFTASCQAGVSPADCPFSSPQPVGFELTLNTDRFCPTVVDTVSVTATLATFSDAACLHPTQAYFLDKTVYVKATLVSPKVSLVSSWVEQVIVTGSAVIAGSLDITPVITVIPSAPETPIFSFVADSAHFQAAPSSFDTLTITAVYGVKYLGNTRALRQGPQQSKITISHDVSLASFGPSAASHLSPFGWM